MGAHIKLTCTVSGNPDPQIVWSKNENEETELREGDGKYKVTRANHACTLEILNSEFTDTGDYSCTATNVLGTASCSAKVNVKGHSRLCGVSKPRVTVSQDDNTVTVCWNAINPDRRSYLVEYREEGSEGCNWEVLVPVCQETSISVREGLREGCSYIFRVTVNGMNETSEDSDPVFVGGELVSYLLASFFIHQC